MRSTGAAAIVPTNFPNPTNLLRIDVTPAAAQTVRLTGMDAGFSPAMLDALGTAADVFLLSSANFFQVPTTGVTLSAALFNMNGFSDTVSWFQGTGSLALTAGAVLTTGDATDKTFSGDITDTGGLVKEGTGKWTLAGAASNTYTGTTTVNAGTLVPCHS